jgi:hypothetical protein
MRPCSCSSASFSSLRILKPFVLAVFVAAMAATSKAQDKVEVFGGYSYLHASEQVGQTTLPGAPPLPNVTQHVNLNGWEFAGQYKPLPFLGAVADFNGNYGTLHGGGTGIHTFLFGPQVSLPMKVSPFAHALFGIAKESQDPFTTGVSPQGFVSLGSDKSWATAIGVGIDVKVAPFIKVRLFQVDYLRTQLHGTTQNQPRASAGVVFHF